MKKPELPTNEPFRLGSLRALDILDTVPEDKFDRLTRMAQRLFNVPIALISLVDSNRQWFKSCVGLSASETPREVSFCGHAILSDDVFVINNALEDERFADNPLVADDPKIRFYAGCPLKSLAGHRFGTLCIIDSQPREFDSNDLATLKDLAKTIEGELAITQMVMFDEALGISNRRGFIAIGTQSLNYCLEHNIPAQVAVLEVEISQPTADKSALKKIAPEERNRALRIFSTQLNALLTESEFFAHLDTEYRFGLITVKINHEETINKLRQIQQHFDQLNSKPNVLFNFQFKFGVAEKLTGICDLSQHITSAQAQLS